VLVRAWEGRVYHNLTPIPTPADWQTLEPHPAALLVPRPTVDEFDTLKASIRQRGFDPHHPIVVCQGRIADGITRRDACIELDGRGELVAPPPFVALTGDVDLAEFVLAENVARRHLKASQRAAMAVVLCQRYEAEVYSNAAEPGDAAILQRGRAAERAAKRLGVSPRYVYSAKRVFETEPTEFRRIWEGRVSLPEALRNLGRRPILVVTPRGGVTRFPPPPSVAPVDVAADDMDDPFTGGRAERGCLGGEVSGTSPIQVWVDGSHYPTGAGDIGWIGAGIVTVCGGVVNEWSLPLGRGTSHEAELAAIREGLGRCRDRRLLDLILYTARIATTPWR
jgi:hypothetical protein